VAGAGAKLVDAIAKRNIRASGGSFESYTSEKNIVTLAQFENPQEVEDVIVDVTEQGTLVQPVLVMIAIPFGLVGVILAFALHQQALGFLAMLGVVGLTGILVNDSLILVNLVNRMKATHPGMTARECIVSATKTRLRPIVLTSITTVAGLLPMAYGLGGSDPFSAPMALAMGYGILFATPITLILIPCLLVVLNDSRGLTDKLINRHRPV
jgi:multidrug efflux pump subunit AcrB